MTWFWKGMSNGQKNADHAGWTQIANNWNEENSGGTTQEVEGHGLQDRNVHS